MSVPPTGQFTKRMLEEYEFPGTDAAVLFIREGQSSTAEVREVLDRSGQQRWYPIHGGHKVKVPWHFSEGHESLFEREIGGWNHEHCDFCNGHVEVGEICWTADSGHGGVWLFCKTCYDTLRQE